jgi:hypothetical protein
LSKNETFAPGDEVPVYTDGHLDRAVAHLLLHVYEPLGGEIIRDLNFAPSLRKVAAQQLIRDVVGVDGGLLIYNGSEEEQRSLDSTSRKLHRFLSQPPR